MAASCSFHPIPRPRREPAVIRYAFAIALNGMRKFARTLKNRRNARLLAGMDDRMLSDIGLTRSDLRDAYAEPLWRDPTDMLAGRARDKRRRRGQAKNPAAFGAPPLAPGQAFPVPSLYRPTRECL